MHKPYVYITIRKDIKTNILYAIINCTYSSEDNSVQIYSIENEHEYVVRDYIDNETIRAHRHECNEIISRFKSIYENPETILENTVGIVRTVPYLPWA